MNLPISLKTLANVLGIVLLIALVAPFVVYAVPGVVGAEHSFVVLTASMTPAIAPGDVVIVDERDPATIAEGDVITFVRGGNDVPVTHRVIDVVDGPTGIAFETQGDANGGPDASLVPGENVLGVVAITIPYIGYVIQFADSPLGFAALVVVPFGLLVLSELWSFVRARNATLAATENEEETGTDDTATSATGFVGAEIVGTQEDADDNAVANELVANELVVDEPVVDEPTGISLDAVVGALAVLLAFAPYSVYVAFQSTTALSLTVAIATTALLLGAAAVWVSATGVFQRSDSRPATETIDAEASTEEVDAEASTEEVDAEASTEEADAEASIETREDISTSDQPPMATDGAGEVGR